MDKSELPPSSSPEVPNDTLAIYNFDHGFTTPNSFTFGPYRIHVKAQHINPAILAKGVTHHFSFGLDENGQLANVTTQTPAHSGRWTPTAEIENHEQLWLKSRLVPEIPNRVEKDDVSLILSFLSGRNVVIGNDAPQQFWLIPGERIVSQTYFYRPPIDWSALASVAAAGGADGMDLICLAMSSPHMMTQFALGSAVLDRLSGNWYSANAKSPYDKTAKEKFSNAKLVFENALQNNRVDGLLISDMMPRIWNVFSESALAKLQAFLAAHGMFPNPASDEATNRLSLLNKHRNAVLHKATVHVVPNTTFEINIQIAAVVATLILIISRVYIAKFLLKIDDGPNGIEQDLKAVLTFFETGKFRSHDVFNETFSDYLVRLEKNWLDGPEIPV